VIAALAGAVVLAGCSTTVRGTATAADGPAEARSAASAPPDAAHLQATLPQLSDVADLPGGWNDRFGEETDDWTMPTLAACLGGRDTIAERLVVRGGQVLTDEHDDRVSSMVAGYRSQRDVDDDIALLTSASAPDCFRQMFEEQLQAARSDTAEVGPLNLSVAAGSDGGPSNVVATVSGYVTVTPTTGESYPAYFDLVFLTGPMTEGQLIFESLGAPFPGAARSRLVTVMAQRLAAL
jgi:hypothetical protein